MQDGFSNIPNSIQKGVSFLSTPTITIQAPPPPPEEVVVMPAQAEPTPPQQQFITAPTQPTEEDEIITDEMAEESAEMFVELLDMFDELILGYLAKRKARTKAVEIAGEDGYNKMKAVLTRIKQTEASKAKGVDITVIESGEDIELAELANSVEAFMDGIELTTRERKRIKKPLQMLVKQRNKKLSPETTLFIAIAMSVGSRLSMLAAI